MAGPRSRKTRAWYGFFILIVECACKNQTIEFRLLIVNAKRPEMLIA